MLVYQKIYYVKWQVQLAYSIIYIEINVHCTHTDVQCIQCTHTIEKTDFSNLNLVKERGNPLLDFPDCEIENVQNGNVKTASQGALNLKCQKEH